MVITVQWAFPGPRVPQTPVLCLLYLRLFGLFLSPSSAQLCKRIIVKNECYRLPAATFPDPLRPHAARAPLSPTPVTSISGDYFSPFSSVANPPVMLHRGLLYSSSVPAALLSLPSVTSLPSGWRCPNSRCPGCSHGTA